MHNSPLVISQVSENRHCIKLLILMTPKMSLFLHLSREHGAHEFRIYRSNNDISCHAQFDAERNTIIIVLSLRVPDIKFL